MALNEDGKFCRNCQRKIPTSNFEVHTAHCQRSILLCPKCREPIHRSEMDEHNQEYHIKVACEKCGSEMEKSEIAHHQNEVCCRRSVKCPFCEIEYLFSNLKEHEEYCGSRTEHCAVCDQYVMLKHLDSHLASNHSILSPEKKKPLVVGENEEHNNNSGRIPQTTNTRILPSVNSIKLKKVPNIIQHTTPLRTSPSKRTNDMPQINTDASDNQLKDTGKFALLDLDELLALHLAEEDLHRIPTDIFSQLVEEFPLGNRTSIFTSSRDFQPFLSDDFDTDSTNVPHFSDETDMDDDILPCEFCGDLFPATYLIQHQSGCRPDVAHGTPSELNNLRPVDSTSSVSDAVLTSDSSEFLNNLIQIRSISPPRDILEDEECLLPCEFCGMQFPVDMLIMHQSACRQDVSLGTSAELNNLHHLDSTSSSSNTVRSLNEEQEKNSLNKSSTGNVASSTKDKILSNAVNPSVGKANSSQYETPPNRRLNESSATNKSVYSEHSKVNEIPYHSSKEYKFSKDKDPLSDNVDSKKTKISSVRETISKEWKSDVLSYNKRGVGTNNYKSHRLEGDAPRSYSTPSVNKTLRGLNTENISGTRPKNQTSSSANRLKRSDIQSRYPLYHSHLTNEPPATTNLSSARVIKYEPRSGLAKRFTSDTWSPSTARSTFSRDKSSEDTQSYRLHDNRLPFRSMHAQQSDNPRSASVLPRIPNTGAVPKQKGKQVGQKSRDTFS